MKDWKDWVQEEPSNTCWIFIYLFSTALTVLMSIILIGVGVLQWLTLAYGGSDRFRVESVPNYIIASYLILFGLVMIVSEVALFFPLTLFAFLFSYIGRGVAFVFMASLAIGIGQDVLWPLALVLCILIMLGGAFYLIIGFTYLRPYHGPRPWLYGRLPGDTANSRK